MSTFTDRTLVGPGGSRGIGPAIALGAAKQRLLASSGVADLSCYGGGGDRILDIFVHKP
jgi:hypothetical protein